jgi:hypothetical protein
MAQKPIFRIAKTNLDALNTVDLGPKRPFGVGECALWARLAGPEFAAHVAALIGLVEAAVTAAEAIAVADLEEANRLAVEFEALGGGTLAMALA